MSNIGATITSDSIQSMIDSNVFDDYIKGQNLADESLIKFLKNAKYGTKDLETYQQYLKDTNQATSHFSSFTEKTMGVLKGFGASLASIGANMAIGILFEALVSHIYNTVNAVEIAKGRLESASGNFDSVTDSINELSDEIKACDDRIEELQKLSDNNTISIAKKEELETLKQTNNELERKLALKKEEQIDMAREELDDIEDLLNKKRQSAYTYVEGTVERGTPQYAEALPEDELKTALDKYYSGDVKGYQVDPKETIENTYSIISPAIKAYESLIEAGYKLSEEENTRYEKLKKLQDEYLLYRYNINGAKETFQALNKEQQRNVILTRLAEQGLSKEQSEAIVNNIPTDEFDKLWDRNFSFVPPEIKDHATAEEYGKAYADAWLNGIQETTNTTLSFSESWKSIGTSGDEKADKKALETKEKLLELAEAGKLTEEAFSNSSIAKNFLKQTKLSAEEATQEINKLVSSADQLSSMKTGISSISSILGDKKENQSSKKTRTKGVGIDTLKEMPEDVKAQTKEYEHFVEVLGIGSSSMEECKEAANKLATAYVTSGNFLANLTDENQDYYKSVLDEMGVENSATIVEDTLTAKKQTHKLKTKALAAATKDMGKKTSAASDEFIQQATMTNLAKVELTDFIAKEQFFSKDCTLSTSSKVKELNKLALAYFGVSNAIQISSAMGSDSRYWNSPEDYENAVQKQWNKTIKKQKKLVIDSVDVKTGNKDKNRDKDGNGNKEKKSKSTQQIDWISRALDRLSSRLDLVKAKYDNLFNNKKAKDSEALLKRQTKNLKDQYKILKKTAKYQERAQKKYSAKSKKVKITKNKKENASLKKAVREGRIKGSMKQLIATYGEKKAAQIQKYQDLYDKAREAEKNKINAQKAARETRIQNYQNIADNADEKRSLAQTQKENATTATAKNDFIKKEKESVEASYNYQIKIANLKRDSLKVDQLRVEKAKELRDLEIEQHQNLADEHQAVLDQYSAEKELAAKASEKNAIITQEEAKTRELYAEKITIAGLEGNSSEQKRLEAELNKQLRDFDVERHQNLADEYQSELDKSSAEKANLTTANKKNAIVEKEKALTKQLYAEKIAIAYIEGKISEGEQLQEELARQMVIIEKEKFDNIAHYYENLMKLKNNSYTNLSNTADEIEARGLIIGASLYNSQIQLNNEKKAGYEEELKLLESQLPQIKEGTDEWYAAQDAIQSCENGIAETTKNTIELNKAIREIPFLLNEKISTRLDLVSSEFELINKFMSNKKMFNDKTGNFTEEGTATLASYYNQLLLAQKETKNTKTALDDMLAAIERGDKGYEDKELAMQEYYERYDEYLKLAGTELDIQQKLIDMMKEKYQAELDYLKDIIDKRKELLDTEKEAYDYQKTIEEKTRNISSLTKQLEASKGDDSEAGKLKLQQLQVSLDEARQDLQDTEYDKWISDQKEMLDKLYNDYSAFIDDHMNDTETLLREAIEYLENPSTKKEFLDTWDTYMTKYDFDPENDLASVLNALGKEGGIVSAIYNLSDIIIHYYDLQQKMSDIIYKNSLAGNSGTNNSNAIDGIIDSPPPTQSSPLPIPPQDTTSQTTVEYVTDPATTFQNAAKNGPTPGYIQSLVDKYQKKATLSKNEYGTLNQYIYEKTNGKLVVRVDSFSNIAEGLGLPKTATQSQIVQKMKDSGYSHGGIADTLQKIPGMNGDDGWATLKRGESVLTPEQTKQFQKLAQNLDVLNSAVNILPNLQKQRYNHSFVPDYNTTQSIGDINIQMEFPNVTNYEEFRQKLQSDPKIEKYVKSVIWDKGDLSKYKINM